MQVDLYVVTVPSFPIGGLSADDVERAAGIPDVARRDHFLRTRSALRAVLAGHLGTSAEELEIRRSEHGKPSVTGVHFSLSHSGPHLVVVTAAGEVGVDIETRTPQQDVRMLADRFFAPEDAARVREAADPPGEFSRQWVAKEAALKALGTGLARHLDRAVCRFIKGELSSVWCVGRRFAITEFRLDDGTPGAVAAEGDVAIELRWIVP